MFDGPPLAPSLWAAVELAGADCSVPTAYGPPRRLAQNTTSRPSRSDMTYTEKDLITTIDRLVPEGRD